LTSPTTGSTNELRVALARNLDLGEGPIWDAAKRRLVFVDGTRGDIHLLDPATGAHDTISAGQTIGAALPRRSGGFVVTAREGLLAVSEAGEVSLLVPVEQDQPGNRMNDAKCDSAGRLWVGTFSEDFTPGAGSLYRIDPDLSVHHIWRDIRVSNGIAWNADESRMYFIDTLARGIDVFDFDAESGTLANQRRFANIPREDGLPDGIAVDADGYVWVALFHGGEVRRYRPDGMLTERIVLPVARVSSCNFGGPELRDLYITTADFRLHDDGQPHEKHAGYLFACQPGPCGLPSHPFGG